MGINHSAFSGAECNTPPSHLVQHTVMWAILLRVLHAGVTLEMGALVRSQFNPLSASENPHSLIAVTRRLGTVASQQLERPYCCGAAGTAVRTFWLVFSQTGVCVTHSPAEASTLLYLWVDGGCPRVLMLGWGASWLIDYKKWVIPKLESRGFLPEMKTGSLPVL